MILSMETMGASKDSDKAKARMYEATSWPKNRMVCEQRGAPARQQLPSKNFSSATHTKKIIFMSITSDILNVFFHFLKYIVNTYKSYCIHTESCEGRAANLFLVQPLGLPIVNEVRYTESFRAKEKRKRYNSILRRLQ